jgi:hypothetical protein
MLLDDNGEELVDPSEASRFKEARAGDHLMTQFQCELCHFWNIRARDPGRAKGRIWLSSFALMGSLFARSEAVSCHQGGNGGIKYQRH